MGSDAIEVTLTTFNGGRSLGIIHVGQVSAGGRAWRASKVLGMCWSIALVTALIPVAHFVLVPAFLLAGPIAAIAAYARERIVIGGSATCPNCRGAVALRRGSASTGFTQNCPSCRVQLNVAPTSPPWDGGATAP
ncbi:MAG: hypothetical protein H0W72_03665 [Planctomycetes bacterium]|nr:hypothetical protein [Planctomycetota bacterium]